MVESRAQRVHLILTITIGCLVVLQCVATATSTTSGLPVVMTICGPFVTFGIFGYACIVATECLWKLVAVNLLLFGISSVLSLIVAARFIAL